MSKNFEGEVKDFAERLNKAIKSHNDIEAKNLIEKLLFLQKSGGKPALRRDAAIVLDNLMKKYGTLDPEDFISPDWKGDFKAIKKSINISIKTRNIIELRQIAKKLTKVLLTNESEVVKNNSLDMIKIIAEFQPSLVVDLEESYIKSILKESNKDILRKLNTLLYAIDPNEYSLDFEETIAILSKKEKKIHLVSSYYFNRDFIVYKVKIKNNMDDPIWDVRFQFKDYTDNFELRRISPEEYEVFERFTVLIPVIQSGDIKEILFTVEPRTAQVYLEGRLMYKKYDENDFRSVATEDIIVDLYEIFPEIEPLTEKVSIIHCREFFDFHVKYKSSNVFALPETITPELAYRLGKRVLSDLKFTLIMDVTNQNYFYGEGLFYARVKEEEGPINEDGNENNNNNNNDNNEQIVNDSRPNDKDKFVNPNKEIVIVLRCSHENYALEINIGCNNNAYLVALQVKFDLMFRQLIKERPETGPNDKVYELRCPNCLETFDKISREWCPWCGEDIDKSKLLG
ncbi:MAG: hypothetical protein ACTSU2_09725 [Promethearchaeota archaeon]